MSFIRGPSNPEGLYICDDVNGYIVIISNEYPAEIVKANRKDWYKLMEGYASGKFTFGGRVGSLDLKEVLIPKGKREWLVKPGTRHNGRPVKASSYQPGSYKMRLTIKNKGKRAKKIYMWRVTWDYIASHEQCGLPRGHDSKAAKRK